MSTRSRFLMLIALLVALTACGGTPSAESPTDNPSTGSATEPTGVPSKPTAIPTAVPEPTATATATPEPIVPGTSRSTPLPINSELRFEDWAVVITGIERGDAAIQAITSANQFNSPAPEGWEYLLATVKLTNISTEQEAKSVLFGVDVRVTGERNILYSRTSVVVPQPLEGDLFPDGSTEGQIAFLVPVGEGNLMFVIAESFSFTDDARRFVAIDATASMSPDPALSTMEATDSGATRNKPASLGTTVVSSNWELTLLEVFSGAEASERIIAANQFNDPAPDGQEYIIARIHVRYLGDGSPDSTANIDQHIFKVTGAANVVYDRPSIVAPAPSLDANLFPGGETEGWVVVQAPIGEADLALLYEPLFDFGNDNLRFLSLK